MILVADGRARLAAVAEDIITAGFAPPPNVKMSDWADQNYILPHTSAEPGRFRTARLPYLRRILDVLGDDTPPEVTLAKSAQVAGSTVGEIWIGFKIDVKPRAMLSVWPTEKKLKNWNKTRLDPMLKTIDALRAKFRGGRTQRREKGDTIFYKEFDLGWLQLLTARSTSDLRSSAAPDAIAEEIDEWEGDVSGQGDPLELLRVRRRTFPYGKTFKVSTPTLEGFSRIWTELAASTWEEYHVPCPMCNWFQTLRWRDGDEEDEAGLYRLVYDRDESGDVVPHSTRYLCEKCNRAIEQGHRDAMMTDGDWRARFPTRAHLHVGFHINTLYSSLVPWDDVAQAWVRTGHQPEKRKVFVNTWCGLPYRAPGKTVEKHILEQRAETLGEIREGEPIEVPHGVGLLTAFVDVQLDHVHLFMHGWCAGEESWHLEWLTMHGDPGQWEIWKEVDAELLRARRHASGAAVPILACAIDAGYQTGMVHKFCDARQGRNVFATVGRAGAGKQVLQAPDPRKLRSFKHKKRPTHVIGTDAAKSLIYSRLRQETEGPGFVHFSDRLDSAYYDQLTAERLVTHSKKGYTVREWLVIENRANHALDGAVGNLGALHYLGPLAIRRLATYAKTYSEWVVPTEPTPATPSGRRVFSSGV